MAPNMKSMGVKDKEGERNNRCFLCKESWMVQKESWMDQEELGKMIFKTTPTPPFQTDVRYVFIETTYICIYELKLNLSATEQTRASNEA